MDSLLESVWLRRRRHLDTDCLAANENEKEERALLRVNHRRAHSKTGSSIATFCLLFPLSRPNTLDDSATISRNCSPTPKPPVISRSRSLIVRAWHLLGFFLFVLVTQRGEIAEKPPAWKLNYPSLSLAFPSDVVSTFRSSKSSLKVP